MRRTKLKLLYENKDISAAIEPYVLSVSYTDYADGQADDLRLTLEDRAGLWRGDWFPDKGATIEASLRCLDWYRPGETIELPFGVFTLDEIEVTGPPATVSLKAVSAFTTTALRREKNTKAWEHTNLSSIAGEIAECHGLSLFFDSAKNIDFRRIDQREESDLSFLARICHENGFALKVSEEKLIVYDGKTADEKPSVMTVTRSDIRLKTYSFNSKSHNVFEGSEISYSDPESKEEKTYAFTPPNPPPCGHKLKLNKRVESLAAAKNEAGAALRRANQNEVTGSLSMVGNPGILAGSNIDVEGFGVFDDKYAVEEAVHSIGSGGYQTEVKIRKVLSY